MVRPGSAGRCDGRGPDRRLCGYEPRKLAEACAPCPVLAYHIPSLTKTNLTVAQLSTLLNIEGVVGFKFTDMDLAKMDSLISKHPRAVIFHGISAAQAVTRAQNSICLEWPNGLALHNLPLSGHWSGVGGVAIVLGGPAGDSGEGLLARE